MLKKLFSALSRKAKKPNKITRIKTPARFAIHAHSLVKNSYFALRKTAYGTKYLEKNFKQTCPVCDGSGIFRMESMVSALPLPFYDNCVACGGNGLSDMVWFSHWYQVRPLDKVFVVNVLCQKEAFKTPLDAPKFLPIVVSK